VLAATIVLGLFGGCSSKSGSSRSASRTTRAPRTTTTSSATGTTASGACTTATTAAGSNGGPEVNPPGDIPDNQAFVPYSPASGGFQVRVPEGWARRDLANGVSFTDKFNSVLVEVTSAPNAPTLASARSVEVPVIAGASRCFRAGTITSVTRRAGSAILIKYTADAAPDPVTGKVVRDAVERYEFWRNGTEVALTLSGAVGADNVDPWRTITDSFAWR
jgi:hypothetical protein